MYEAELKQAYINDVRLLNETRLNTNGVKHVTNLSARINVLAGSLQNAPKSFSAGKEMWSLFAIPEFQDALVGTEYEFMTTLKSPADKHHFEAYLELALSQGKGLITYFPNEVSRVKTLLNHWTVMEYGSPPKRAVDAAMNMSEAMRAARDLYVILIQIFGVAGVRERLHSILTSGRKGIGSGERKFDYGIFIPNNLHSSGEAFKAFKRMNDALMDRQLPYIDLPQTSNEFDIRANIRGNLIGEYLIMLERDQTVTLRSRNR